MGQACVSLCGTTVCRCGDLFLRKDKKISFATGLLVTHCNTDKTPRYQGCHQSYSARSQMTALASEDAVIKSSGKSTPTPTPTHTSYTNISLDK